MLSSQSTSNCTSLVVLFLVLLLETTAIAVPAPRPSFDNNIFHRKHIQVYNYLPNDASFDIHCKSGNNDLGQKHITAQSTYTFSFKPNIDGSTLFYCGVSWTGGRLEFDIYDYQRDMDRCDHNCVWDVKSYAILGYKESDEQPDITIPWQKP